MSESPNDRLAIRDALRTQFNAPARSAEIASAVNTDTVEKTVELMSREQALFQKAREHFAAHKDQWINREQRKVLTSLTGAKTLMPKWAADDRIAMARRVAETAVIMRQCGRMARIENATTKMIRRVQSPQIKAAFQRSAQHL